MSATRFTTRHTFSAWCATAALAAASLLAMPAQALTSGTWQLHNHPDGSAAEPLYGLRLDELLGQGVYSFDFDATAQGAAMFMDIDDASIVIYGSAWGGLDTGSSYDSPALWDIYMTYDIAGSTTDGGVDDVYAHTGSGTLTRTDDELTFILIADAGAADHAFSLGDENGSGYGTFDGVSGWGFLNYYLDSEDPYLRESTSNFLFTASPVPVPPALWLFATSVFSFLIVRRRSE